MTTDISVSVRWDPATQQEVIDDYDYDGGNSSSRLFERSRIKALAGKKMEKKKCCRCRAGFRPFMPRHDVEPGRYATA